MALDAHFIKRNATQYGDALLKEAEGLKAIQALIDEYDIEEINTPRILSVCDSELRLERITSVTATDKHMQMLGVGLARLHQVSQINSRRFGYHHDNYIGLNPQTNAETDRWGDFFVYQRLLPQVEKITNASLRAQFTKQLNDIAEPLVDFLNRHSAKPALCHGDLWSGNVLFSTSQCWLIDPAVYFADRETDLAMTQMFGGFSQTFYHAYDRVFPRQAHSKEKQHIYNLYHYLNHYNLFGDCYLQSCKEAFADIHRQSFIK